MGEFNREEWLERLLKTNGLEEFLEVLKENPVDPDSVSIYELTFGMTLEEMVEQYPDDKELLVRLIEMLSISNDSFTEQERAIYERLTSDIQAEKT